MHAELINEPQPKTEMRVSKALTWAARVFWIDIVLTLVVLAAVASRF